MALGAGRAAVLRMLLGEIAVTAGAGAGIGLLAAWAAMRAVQSMLFGIEPHDPATFALSAAAMMLIVLAAALLPACRALRIDPVRALRYE